MAAGRRAALAMTGRKLFASKDKTRGLAHGGQDGVQVHARPGGDGGHNGPLHHRTVRQLHGDVPVVGVQHHFGGHQGAAHVKEDGHPVIGADGLHPVADALEVGADASVGQPARSGDGHGGGHLESQLPGPLGHLLAVGDDDDSYHSSLLRRRPWR